MVAGLLLQYVPAGTNFEWTVGGNCREARVVTPRRTENAPIVICFHGGGGQAYYAVDEYAVHKNWPEAVVYYAQGLVGNGGYSTWDRSDVAFFDTMRSDAIHRLRADPKRLFLMGYSTGANLCGDLWGLRGEKIAGFAFVSGGRASRKWPARPVFLSYGETEPDAPRLRALGTTLSAWSRAGGPAFALRPRPGGHTYPQAQDEEIAAFLKACAPLR